MAITKSFMDAVARRDVKIIRIMMKNSLLIDLTFQEYSKMGKLAANVPGLYDEHDGREFILDRTAWDDDYMDELMVQVVGNFSHERLDHLQEVIRYLRPVNKKNTNKYKPDNFMKNAINNKNIDKIHGALIALLQSDPAFMTTELEDAISYLQNVAHINPFIDGNLDPKTIKENKNEWDQRYFAEAVTRLRHDFTYERYLHVIEVSKFTHQELRKRQENERNIYNTDSINEIKDKYKKLAESMYDYSNFSNAISKYENFINKITSVGIVRYLMETNNLDKNKLIEDITGFTPKSDDIRDLQKEYTKFIKGSPIKVDTNSIISYKTIIDNDSIGEKYIKNIENIYKKLQKVYGECINRINNDKDIEDVISNNDKNDINKIGNITSGLFVGLIRYILTFSETIYLLLLQNVKDMVASNDRLGQFYASFAKYKPVDEVSIFDNIQLI